MRARTGLIAALATGLVLSGGAWVAQAATATPDTITACAKKAGGALRYSTNGDCRADESRLTWPSGPTPFPATYAGTNRVTVEDTDQRQDVEVLCDVGDLALHGSVLWRIPAGTGQALSWSEGPRVGGLAEGWGGFIATVAPDTVLPINVSVTCLDTALPAHTS